MNSLLGWAKEQKLRRVELKVLTRNTPAISLYKSLAFVEEGVHRISVLKQGVWCDDLTMAMLLGE